MNQINPQKASQTAVAKKLWTREFSLMVLFALVMVCAAFSVAAQEKAFYGYAYDLDSGEYIYTELHRQQFVDGKETVSSIQYFDAEGEKIGEKSLDYRADYFVPVYEMTMTRSNYVEGISSNKGQIDVYKVVKGERETKTLDKPKQVAADSGFHHYVQSRFTEVMKGDKVSFRFVAAGNLGSYKFRARRIDDTEFEGKKAVQIRVEADSLLRLVAPDLTLTYDPDSKRLLEYKGPSNVKNPATDKVYDVRISYYSTPPENAGKLPLIK